MPSPFPGMDPYLEHPELWGDFHDSLITYIRESLQPALPEPYFAQTGKRLWVETTRRPIEPDVQVRRAEGSAYEPTFGTGGAATALAAEPVVITVPHDEHREPFIEIRSADGNTLVTVVEVLSPTNKTPGEHGRGLYLEKQQEILDGKVHLVEIDLLRGGEHTTAVPLDWALEKTGPFDYHVCIHRFDTYSDYIVHPVRLQSPLPTIDVPLLPGDGSVRLDLQDVFNRTYDTGPYRRCVHYGESEIVPALSDAHARWAADLVLRARRP
ncbi:MAG TPA: DUF4058 family protein [Planctomycetaceae bacterium]|nr:DUF4058 family protein [Planctomycetaceae bacterium]